VGREDLLDLDGKQKVDSQGNYEYRFVYDSIINTAIEIIENHT